MRTLTDVERLAVVAEVRSWIGTPFRHQGRLKGIACDCVGLGIAAARAAGVSEELIAQIPHDYTVRPIGDDFRRIMDRYADKVELADAKVADVALLAWRRYPMHMGVLGNYLHRGAGAPLTLIHADMAALPLPGRVTEQRLDPTRCTLVGIYRFRLERPEIV